MASNLNVPIAQGNNRTTSGGYVPITGIARTYSIVNVSIAAGATLALPQTGDNFYFPVLTAPIQARPRGGLFNTFYQGTGAKVDPQNQFAILELYNPNTFPVGISVFVGFGEYIDNRVIISNDSVSNVAFPTYSSPSTSAIIQIPDKSGTKFTDVNGRNFVALARTAISINNLDNASNLYLEGSPSGTILYAVYPLTSAAIPTLSGNYLATVNGSSMVNGIISEIYSAIPATF